MPALAKAFSIIRSGSMFPAFSGVSGQIDMAAATRSGQKVQESNALRVSAIYIATTTLADEIASLILKIVKKEDVNRTPIQPPELRALWSEDPNDDQTRFGIDVTETLSLVLWGASYTMLGWTNAGELDVRWPINPEGVALERIDGGGLKLISNGQGDLSNRRGERPEFSYVPMYVLPGKMTPVSPIRMAAELAGLSLAYEETAARLMGRGLNPSALLTFGEPITQEIAEDLSKRLERAHGGSSKAGGVAVIGGPTPKLERLGMSMADAEFVAQNEQVFKILLAMWRVPPTIAGMVDKPSTWGTGVAEFSRGLERFTLRPIVQRRQAALTKYVTRWVDPDLQAKYVFDSMLSAAPKERVEIQRSRLMAGMTSVERVLAQEDEPPFAETETVYSQLSMTDDQGRRALSARQNAEAIVAQGNAVQSLLDTGLSREVAWRLVNPEITNPAIASTEISPISDVQATALNGAQITSLLFVLQDVTANRMAAGTARALIQASFPSLAIELINTMVDSAVAFISISSA